VNQQPDQDGALKPAIKHLGDAIHRLTGQQSRFLDGKLLYTESRYMQLRDATAGEQVNSGGGGGSKSQPPVWLDAVDLLNEIDTAVEILQPAFTGVPPTIGRLRWIEARKWRPQDTGQIERITRAVAEWAHEIDALLDPPQRWTLPDPCPACNQTTAYRRDSGGERVRTAALQIDPTGCRCAACGAVWEPTKFEWLGKLLGREKPEGVIG
jgi:hypothetical protein